MIIKVTGVSRVIGNLRRSYPLGGAGCERGMKISGLMVLRKSQKEVPVEFGPLKASGFTRNEGTGKGFNAIIAIGYTAAYSIFVHENMDNLHGEAFNAAYAKEIANPLSKVHSRGPGQKSKFLEDPVKRSIAQIVSIITEETKKGFKRLG